VGDYRPSRDRLELAARRVPCAAAQIDAAPTIGRVTSDDAAAAAAEDAIIARVAMKGVSASVSVQEVDTLSTEHQGLGHPFAIARLMNCGGDGRSEAVGADLPMGRRARTTLFPRASFGSSTTLTATWSVKTTS
jgi:hypothetical protein